MDEFNPYLYWIGLSNSEQQRKLDYRKAISGYTNINIVVVICVEMLVPMPVVKFDSTWPGHQGLAKIGRRKKWDF